MGTNIASVNLQHSIIHKQPERFGVNENIEEEIRKNIHLTPKYIRDDKNQLNSAEVLLNEYGYKTLLNNTKDRVKYLSFTTPFFEKMIETQEIVVDATYKTNVFGYELYAIIGQFDGSGFAMTYLFVEGSKKSDRAQTEILTLFFRALYDLGMKNIQFFLTDKDFAQILAAQQIWPHVKIQICL
ncbi:ATP-dependent DNA helicase PIF1 [Rhizophagus irregularis DAOM 181602=DAOM 197198]|nr:ATP-dependent DNA helicase PIF1 [Rhizophagus irregularis DAOM 181602=DAOM 197198]